MSVDSYIQINIIPFLALLILRLNARTSLSYSWRNRALRFSLVLVMGIIATTTAAWFLDGKEGRLVHFAMWVVNFAYFALIGFTAFLWYLYVRDIVKNEVGQRGRMVLRPAIPLIAFYVTLCFTPLYPLIFDIDGQNHYVRGPLYFVYVGEGIFYVAASVILVVRACSHEPIREKKRTYYRLFGIAGLTALGGMLQVVSPGVEMLWPLLTAALMGVYLNVQREQVMRDGLTGLNNRRRFDQYIRELAEKDLTGDSWRFAIIDMDRFKMINDTYGHVIGDRTLKLLAEQMKKVFGNRRSFLARYGGDEFSVILNGMSEEETKEAVERLRKAVTGMHWLDNKRWDITLSIGVAAYGENGITDIPKLIMLADERMYQEKHRHHGDRET